MRRVVGSSRVLGPLADGLTVVEEPVDWDLSSSRLRALLKEVRPPAPSQVNGLRFVSHAGQHQHSSTRLASTSVWDPGLHATVVVPGARRLARTCCL